MIKRTDNVFANRSNLGLCTPGTRIPRATNNSNNMSSPDHTKETVNLSTYVEKWKNRYEDSERRHKAHLLKAEKAKREYDDLTRRYNIALEERNHLSNELLERERELNKLRQVSEKLFQEYQQLKHQHDLDKGIMEKVMQQAGEWYKQNKKLKRRSTALLSALPVRPTDIDLTDSTDTASDTSSNEEVEFLKQTVSELSAQVATLQADLSAVRLSEFEAHELQVTLAQELEQEREKSQVQEKELQELRSQIEQHNRVSKLLIDEVSALKNNADKDREMAETYKSEAMTAKKRVRLLTHQSALLMGELEMDERLMLLLNEVDSLKEALENQALRHREQIEELQLKLTEKHEDTDILLWEEKIRLAEDDARRARERAERAEKRLTQVQEESKSGGRRRGGIMSKISYFESGGESRENIEAAQNIALSTTPPSVSEPESLSPNSIPKSQSPQPSLSTNTSTSSRSAPSPVNTDHVTSSASASHVTSTSSVSVATEAVTSAPPPPPPPPVMPPPPPPPPPPPAPPAVFNGNAPTNMADLLASKQGTLKKSSKQNGGGAIDAIVDQIKGGKFQLKSTEQNFLEKKPKDEQPEAVKEMLAILGTLRKRRSVNRTSSFVSSKSVDKS